MKAAHVVIGIVMFILFWAYQAGYAASLGPAAWFVAALVFSVLLMAMGKTSMEKPQPDIKSAWQFSIAFVLISTLIISFAGQSLGAVVPADPSAWTPMLLSFWLVVFGGAMLVTGWKIDSPLTTLVGIIWLFSALHFVTAVGTGANSYLHFGLVTGLTTILAGLFGKAPKA
ncbi:MAG: hypothetical protein HY369_05360 [Candidatus Aenigmarchaeota archaeon]|nr:hypothetical protein [Candidatus Aenigmarchaeota archaeon]